MTLNTAPVAILTGSCRGNGLAIAKRLIDSGYQLVTVDKQALPVGLDVAVHFEVDLSLFTGHADVIEAATDISRRVMMINNAGVSLSDSENNHASWDQTIAVNLSAPYLFLSAYSKALLKKAISEGSIVNITSLASHRGFGDNPAYCASKAGLLGLTRAYAESFGAYGIRVNSVSPGYIQTEMTQKSHHDLRRRQLISNHSMLERWGQSDEVASLVSFLLSDEASFITGSDVPIDGGWLSKGLVHMTQIPRDQ